ncbi:MAG: hypothetical protein AAF514_00935 [Verrucomicrobiota bacterium]
MNDDGDGDGDERDFWGEIVRIVRGPVTYLREALERKDDREAYLKPLWGRIVFLAFGGIALYGAVAGLLVDSWWVWWSTVRFVGAAATGLLLAWGLLTFLNLDQGWAWCHVIVVNLGFTEILLEFGTLLNLVLSWVGSLSDSVAVGVVGTWVGMVAIVTTVLSALQFRALSVGATFWGTLLWVVAFWGGGGAFWVLWAK